MNENGEPNQQQAASSAGIHVGENSTPAQPATEQQLREAEQKIEGQIEERMTGFERSMVRLTRFGLAVTILTGIIFAGQLYEMYTGGTQTDKLVNYARVQANSAGDQADAAQQFSDTAEDINGRMSEAVDQLTVTADNAKASIRAAQDSLRTDQRAWMDIIINAPPSFQEDRPFTTTAEMKNLGKTPAKNIQFGHLFESLPPSTHQVFDDKRLQFSNAGMLPPQGPAIMPVEITQGHPDELLGKGRFEAIRDGKMIVFYWGLIKYDDVFGVHHWLKFCYIYNVPHRSFNLVSIHNEIDEETR